MSCHKLFFWYIWKQTKGYPQFNSFVLYLYLTCAPFPLSQHRITWIFLKMLAKWEDTKYPYYSCLHEMTFIKSPFECSNSNLVHQQNTIKQFFNLHSSKFTLLLFQHKFLRVKSWKSGVIRSFNMKFRKKSGIAQNQE